MQIIELYPCIQGEGKLTGKSSILIRTTGCNLRCEWQDKENKITKCDTPYTSWKPEKGQDISVENVIGKCFKDYPNIKHIIISGGEPFLQPELPKFTAVLRYYGYHITIETNGTLHNPGVICDLLSVSPKTYNSIPKSPGTEREKELHTKALHNSKDAIKWNSRLYNCQFKFVVNSAGDTEEILLFQKTYDIKSDDIYLMPEGTEPEHLARYDKLCQDLAIKHGWNYSDRIHLRVHGNKRLA